MAAESFLDSLCLITGSDQSQLNIKVPCAVLWLGVSEPEWQRGEIRQVCKLPAGFGNWERVTRPGHCRFPLVAVGRCSLLSLFWTSAHRDMPGHWRVAFPGQTYLSGKWKHRRGLGHKVKQEMALAQRQRTGPLYPLSSKLSTYGCDPNLSLGFFSSASTPAIIRPLEWLPYYNRYHRMVLVLFFIAFRTRWGFIAWRAPFGWFAANSKFSQYGIGTKWLGLVLEAAPRCIKDPPNLRQRRASVEADHITNHLQRELYQKGEVTEDFDSWKASLLKRRLCSLSMFRGWSVPLSTRIMDPTEGEPPPCVLKGSLSSPRASTWKKQGVTSQMALWRARWPFVLPSTSVSWLQ